MTELEARTAVESAYRRADVRLADFAFYDEQKGTTVLFDGFSRSVSAGQTPLFVVTSEHGRKAGGVSGVEHIQVDELEQYAYNFAVDWLDEVKKR